MDTNEPSSERKKYTVEKVDCKDANATVPGNCYKVENAPISGGGSRKMVYKKKYKGWAMFEGPRGGLYIRLSKGRFEAFSKFQKRVNI